MKKKYIKPLTESIYIMHHTSILEGSYNDHADGKQGNFFDDEEGEMSEPWKSKRYNLWEE